MENFLSSMPLIKSRNIIGMSLRKDLKIPMIDTGDIADFAARLLLRLDYSGPSRPASFLGAGDYSMEEAARTLGKAMGKDGLSLRPIRL